MTNNSEENQLQGWGSWAQAELGPSRVRDHRYQPPACIFSSAQLPLSKQPSAHSTLTVKELTAPLQADFFPAFLMDPEYILEQPLTCAFNPQFTSLNSHRRTGIHSLQVQPIFARQELTQETLSAARPFLRLALLGLPSTSFLRGARLWDWGWVTFLHTQIYVCKPRGPTTKPHPNPSILCIFAADTQPQPHPLLRLGQGPSKT